MCTTYALNPHDVPTYANKCHMLTCHHVSSHYLSSRLIPYICPNPSCPKFKTIPPASGGSRLQALPRPRTRSSPCETCPQIPNSPPKWVGTWLDASDKQQEGVGGSHCPLCTLAIKSADQGRITIGP